MVSAAFFSMTKGINPLPETLYSFVGVCVVLWLLVYLLLWRQTVATYFTGCLSAMVDRIKRKVAGVKPAGEDAVDAV